MNAEEHIAEIIADWQERCEQGEQVDPEELIRSHPELALELRERFEAMDLLGRVLADRPPLPEGVPETIGEYRIIREIGRGGMGVVYEAEQSSMGRRVALKLLSLAVMGSAKAVRRFRREAQAAGRLHHANIVPVYGLGEHAGYWYYAMELVEGRPLSQVIADMRAQGEPTAASADPEAGSERSQFMRVAEMFADVAEALQLAHQAGVIHRDIKPSNLLLAADGALKIVDFGLARSAGEGPPETMTGEILGTPAYMSPEQARARQIDIDHRTDVYSLGATLYEFVTKSPPFEGDTIQEICMQIATQELIPPRKRDQRIPRDLETILLKAMRKDREERYRTAAELAYDLRQFSAGLPILARREGLVARAWRKVRRNRVRAGLVALLLVLGTAGALLARWGVGEAARNAELEYARWCSLGEEAMVCATEESRAREHFARAVERVPDHPDAYLWRALASGASLETRLEDLGRARARGLSLRTFHLARAHLFCDEGDPFRAGEEERLAGTGAARTPLDDYFEARLRHAAGESDAAMTIVSRVLEAQVRRVSLRALALRFRAALRREAGSLAGALADLRSLELLGDESADVAVGIASLERRTGRGGERFLEVLAAVRREGSRTAWARLCAACRVHGDWDWLETASEEALRKHAGAGELVRERALSLCAAGRFKEALPLWEGLSDHRAHHWRGRTLKELGRHEEARDAFDRALAGQPGCLGTLLQKGALLAEHLRDPEGAIEVFKRAPDAVEALCGKARVLCRLGRFQEAADAGREAVAIDAGDADAHTVLSCALRHLGQGDEALDGAEHAIRLDHDSATARFHRARALVARGRLRDAREELDRVVRLDPRNPRAHCLRGEVLEGLELHADAMWSYEKAIELDPGVARPRVGRAGLLARVFRAYGQALDEWRAASKLCPRSAACRAGTGAVLRLLGRHGEALAALDGALEIDDSLATAHQERGIVLALTGDGAGALAALEQACARGPESAEAHHDRGCALRSLGRYDEALEAYARAIELDASCREALDARCFVQVIRLRAAGRAREARDLARARLREGRLEDRMVRAYLQAAAGEGEQAKAILGGLAPSGHPALLFERARIHAILGEVDDALRCLETAIEKGYRRLAGAPPGPDFESLAANPRYAALLERIVGQ